MLVEEEAAFVDSFYYLKDSKCTVRQDLVFGKVLTLIVSYNKKVHHSI